jgi:NAD(P)-dependent dehydrogenase (short-subunit alcohol dehydrogenase family)
MKNPVTATIQGILEMRKKTGTPLPSLGNDERVDGQTIMVTGANRGLGKAVAVQLAQRGAHVVMAGRSGIPEAGEEVARESGSSHVQMRSLDLADLRDVVRHVDELARAGVRLDQLVLNAGVVPLEARPTAQGFELMFGVNYLANVLLVERLLARGVLVPDAQRPPRIVFVSSETHRGAGPIHFGRLGRFESYGGMGGVKVYGYTKLLLNTYAAHLAARLGRTASVHSLCPGAVNTDIAREAPEWVKPLLGRVMALWFRPPEAAAEPVVYLCCARALEKQTGRYLHVMVDKPADPESVDPRVGERLFRESEALVVRAIGERFAGPVVQPSVGGQP